MVYRAFHGWGELQPKPEVSANGVEATVDCLAELKVSPILSESRVPKSSAVDYSCNDWGTPGCLGALSRFLSLLWG